MSASRPTHARKGREGKGVGREDESLLHASHLTEGAVDNPPASATAPLDLRAGCSAFGGVRRWGR